MLVRISSVNGGWIVFPAEVLPTYVGILNAGVSPWAAPKWSMITLVHNRQGNIHVYITTKAGASPGFAATKLL